MNGRDLRVGYSLLGLLLLASCGPGACDDEDVDVSSTTPVYTSVADCVAGGSSTSDCNTALDAAKKQYQSTAPVFQTYDQCVAYAGDNCGQRDSSDGFMPFMAGFMLGHLSGSVVSQPIYVVRGTAYSGRSSIGSWSYSGSTSGIVTAPRSGFGGSSSVWSGAYADSVGHVAISTASVSRGGFGSSSAGHASGGE